MSKDITELKKAEEELVLLQKINNMINSGVGLEKVLETVVDGLRSVYDYDSVAIHFLSKDQKHLIIKSYSVDSIVARKLEKLTGLTVKGYKAPLYEGSLLKEIVDTKKPVITDDIIGILKSYSDRKSLQNMAEIVARLTEARWGVGIPLMAGDRVVGTIGCGSIKKPTDKDSKRLANFGVQAGLAIEKAERTREIEESEKKYSTLVEKGNDGIVIIQEGLLKFVNAKMAEITGFSLEEAIGKSFIDFVSPEYRELVMDRYKKRISGEEVPNRYEIEILSKDGRKIPVEINAAMIEYGDRPADMAIIRDITERKRVEDVLRESEESYRTLIESSTDAVISIDEGRATTLWNKAAEEILGYSRDDVIGGSVDIIVPEKYLESHKRGVKRFLKTGKVKIIGKTVEVEAKRKDGKIIPVELSLSVVKLEGGYTFTGILRDITERKQAEEDVQKRVEELEEFHRITVDRELKMIELEKEIERLKEELKKVKEGG